MLILTVLILIIVDNGLVPKIRQNMPELSCCINPCCSGQWSSTFSLRIITFFISSLNPCCSGQWSSTMSKTFKDFDSEVLILVVVDNGLVLNIHPFNVKTASVLILVVVDNGLVHERF